MPMRILTFALSMLIPALAWSNPLVGAWEYDADRIVSELRGNPATPSKILKCFELKACGHNVRFEYSETRWRQITKFEGSPPIASDYTDYQVLELTPDQITINTIIDGSSTTAKYRILGDDEVSTTIEYEGFQWNEYYRRAH